jgi:predicted amidohydrolase
MKQKPSTQEVLALTQIDGYIDRMIQKALATPQLEQGRASREDAPKRLYNLVFRDLLKASPRAEKGTFRVGIAQIGVSPAGDILGELFKPPTAGFFTLRAGKVDEVQSKVEEMVERAYSKDVNLLVFPELTIDLAHVQLYETLLALAKNYKMYIIPGSYHDQATRRNLSLVMSPTGVLWEQAKHIPAVFRYGDDRITEGISPPAAQRETIIAKTEYGRIAVVICRDFLDLDLRVELKNFKPNVDLIINPSFTPVTADFEAAHFDSRRSIYAYCLFANAGEFGNSFIMSPERERDIPMLPAREEDLIFKDVDLFKLRAERRKWETKVRRTQPFIQSTR